MSAFTGMFGRGGFPHAAIHMGRQDNKTAEKFLGNSLFMLLLTSVLITAGVLSAKIPLLLLLVPAAGLCPMRTVTLLST